jgi:hypothetical protein
MFMREFFSKIFTLIIFIAAMALFYAALTVNYSNAFFNLILIIISIFVLLIGCGRVDKAMGLGKYAEEDNNNHDAENTM